MKTGAAPPVPAGRAGQPPAMPVRLPGVLSPGETAEPAASQLPGDFAELREPEVAEFIQLPLLLLVAAVPVVSEEVVEVLARQ